MPQDTALPLEAVSVEPLLLLHDQLAALIQRLPEGAYQTVPVTGGGSIGGHVRHSLDHVQALIRAGGQSGGDARL